MRPHPIGCTQNSRQVDSLPYQPGLHGARWLRQIKHLEMTMDDSWPVGTGAGACRHNRTTGHPPGVVRLNQMARQFDTAIIVVTHDEKIIPTFKRVYHIRDGVTLEEVGEGRGID